MKINEFLAETKAQITGEKYGSNDIVLINSRRDRTSKVEMLPVEEKLIVENNGLKWDFVSEESLSDEKVSNIKKKPSHPRTWDPSDFGCGYGYSRAVNDYYADLRQARIQTFKKIAPKVVISTFLIGFTILALKEVIK